MSTDKLIAQANSIEHSFSEIVRKIMRQKFVAKFKGDEATADALNAEEQKIRTALHEARDRIFRVNLSDTKIDELISALDDETKAARQSLKAMQDLADFLEKAKKAAKVATDILKTVRTVVGIV